MKKLFVVAICALLLLPAVSFASSGEEVYQKSCGFCHNTGVANAPKLGDKEAWKGRIDEGMDELYKVAIHGEGAMPAKGGNASLSDDEVKAAVDYMVEQSK